MMDRLYNFRVKVNHIACIISSKAELNSSDGLNLVRVLQQDNKLSYDIVDSRSNLAKTNNISTDSTRVKVLCCSWTCPHKLLLSFNILPSPKYTVLYDEFPWLHECLGHEERLIAMAFDFFGDKWARVCLRIMYL